MSNRGGKLNNKELKLAREAMAWDLRVHKNLTHRQIAVELGIQQPAVTKILKRVTAEFFKLTYEKVEHVKMEQVAQIEVACQQAMDSWLKSKEPLPKSEDDESDKPSPPRCGNPQYLLVYLKGKEDIRKILGIDAATKTQTAITVDGEYEATIDGVLGRLSASTALLASPPDTGRDS